MSHPTRIGELTLAATSHTLICCAFETREEVAERIGNKLPLATDPTPLQQRVLHDAMEQIDSYLDGRRQAFTLPLDLCLATDFVRLTVHTLSRTVPYGSTTTYGALAAAIGRPRSARAVGRALGANPLCVLLPCHRAVGAGGKLTGYAGGINAKDFLLTLERSG
ncbi:methylated-DNA--[protein]-cysteine S-methyltransferase [Streptomyces sp. NPDC046985]|uniref:methylated-DNA--[protein]-cysteine S-methyltransferase n=1 Tax=Streptomyces sp. NPDC046985 TaxID=3155377 RepID=UPI0034007052